MSLTVSTQVPPVGTKLVSDTNANQVVKTAVTGAAGSIFLIDIDNSGNSDNAAYLKIYDVSSVSVGSTAPDFIFKVPVNQRRSFAIPDGLSFSFLSFAVVTTPGTAGNTGPTNPVTVKMVTT